GASDCYSVWGMDNTDGVESAFFEKDASEPIWNKQIAAHGRHPAVAMSDSPGAQIVWFEGGKVMTTHLPRDAPSIVDASAIGSVSTPLAPAPMITNGSKPNEWLLAWIDSEVPPNPQNLRGEVYVSRVECK